MSLPQPLPEYELSPLPQRQPRTRPQRAHAPQPAHRRHRALGWELTARLGVNLGLSLVALAALTRLVAHYQTQQTALAALSGAIVETEASTAQLQAEFGRYFDPAYGHPTAPEGYQSGYRLPIVVIEDAGTQP